MADEQETDFSGQEITPAHEVRAVGRLRVKHAVMWPLPDGRWGALFDDDEAYVMTDGGFDFNQPVAIPDLPADDR